jgi:hypothetical protein
MGVLCTDKKKTVARWRGKVIVSGHVGWGWEGGHYSDGFSPSRVYFTRLNILSGKGFNIFFVTFVLF